MKTSVFILGLALVFSACSNKNTREDNKLNTNDIEVKSGENNPEPKFEWKEKSWDFGTIEEGEHVEHTFKFKNIGDDDLIISDASASCGCTIPVWPKEPIKPGDEGKIKVEFNSSGKTALQTKDITILANTTPVKSVLQIKAYVNKKP